MRVNEKKVKRGSLYYRLILDGMAVKKLFDFHGDKYLGTGETDDSANDATQALVFLVVCVNGHWKCPLARYFISALHENEKANIVYIA